MIQITNKQTGEVKNYTEAEFIAERDRLLLAWEESKKALEVAKEKEMEQRKAVVAFAFDPNKENGTERIELGNGYQAKAVKKVNYSFIKTEGGKLDKAAIDKALSKIEKVNRLELKWLIKAYQTTSDKTKFFNEFFTKLAGTKKLQQQMK